MNEAGSDVELVYRLCNRDPQALAAIYDRYAQGVYSVLVRITHDRTASEDLLQELFLRVWNRAVQFDSDRGNLRVWLLTVARNLALDQVRSAASQFESRLLCVEQLERFGDIYPEARLHRVRSANVALSTFPSREKQVLELAYFEGFSQSEIASCLQEPLGTVKSWIQSGLTRLRLSMQEFV